MVIYIKRQLENLPLLIIKYLLSIYTENICLLLKTERQQMGKNITKDGIVTNTLQLIPFGGILTAPFHTVAGNKVQTVKALVIGTVSGAAFLAGLGVASTAIGFLASSLTQKMFFNTKNPSLSKEISPEKSLQKSLQKRVKIVNPEKPMSFTISRCKNMKAVVLVNLWGYSLSVNDQGVIFHQSKNRNRYGCEGWVIQQFGKNLSYISRNSGSGKLVIAISDEGIIYATTNRCSLKVFQIKHWQDYDVMTFQRVKEPRWYLACTNKGKICASKKCNLQGWEAWIPK